MSIWRQFNEFLIRLDHRPLYWEQRVALYVAYLVDKGRQSSSIRSYISGIKAILKWDDYQWDDDRAALTVITRACRPQNDKVKTCLPIQLKLLELLLFEIQREFFNAGQRYLEKLYIALFSLAYYGLMRIGELTSGSHPIRAKDIHIADNKDKILMHLYTSKTHGQESDLREIKVSAVAYNKDNIQFQRFFCPFTAARKFMAVRGGYDSDNEPFFVFADRNPVEPKHVRAVLIKAFKAINLDHTLYTFSSFRAGRASNMFKFGYSFLQIKCAGRWKSSAIYRYIRGHNYHQPFKDILKSITGKMVGYDKVWFFGDNFGFNTFSKYYHDRPMREYLGYVRDNYEVTGFLNNKDKSLDRNLISRLCNLLIGALSDYPLLPKMIVIVPDEDILRFIIKAGDRELKSNNVTIVVKWLMREYERIIAAHQEKLPSKAKKAHCPYFIWIAAPTHKNFDNNNHRVRFNKALLEAGKLFANVAVLELKKIWDPEDTNLFTMESNRFTATGIQTYWGAVDRTVQYADTTLLRKIHAKVQTKEFTSTDRFRWRNKQTYCSNPKY